MVSAVPISKHRPIQGRAELPLCPDLPAAEHLRSEGWWGQNIAPFVPGKVWAEPTLHPAGWLCQDVRSPARCDYQWVDIQDFGARLCAKHSSQHGGDGSGPPVSGLSVFREALRLACATAAPRVNFSLVINHSLSRRAGKLPFCSAFNPCFIWAVWDNHFARSVAGNRAPCGPFDPIVNRQS